MAVANAVGSNVFDIWLGLGLPWLLYVSWQDPNCIEVSTDELVPSALARADVLVLYYGSVALNGFNLTVRMGYTYMATYVVYALYSIILVWLLDIYDLEKEKAPRTAAAESRAAEAREDASRLAPVITLRRLLFSHVIKKRLSLYQSSMAPKGTRAAPVASSTPNTSLALASNLGAAPA